MIECYKMMCLCCKFCLISIVVFSFFLSLTVNAYPELEIQDCAQYSETSCDETLGWCEWSTKYSVCQVTTKVNVQAIFVEFYQLATNPFWSMVLPCIYVFIFTIAREIIKYLVYVKHWISESYYEKCVVYMFEILSLILMMFYACYPTFFYLPVFDPDKFESVTAKEYRDYYGTTAFVGMSIVIVYVFEIMYTRNMRFQLKIHHWTSIFAGKLIYSVYIFVYLQSGCMILLYCCVMYLEFILKQNFKEILELSNFEDETNFE